MGWERRKRGGLRGKAKVRSSPSAPSLSHKLKGRVDRLPAHHHPPHRLPTLRNRSSIFLDFKFALGPTY